jgi:hypothetical protein
LLLERVTFDQPPADALVFGRYHPVAASRLTKSGFQVIKARLKLVLSVFELAFEFRQLPASSFDEIMQILVLRFE